MDEVPNNHGQVIIFIDRSNLELSFRKNVGQGDRIDYVRLVAFLSKNATVKQVRIYYSDFQSCEFLSQDEQCAWKSRQDFYSFLHRQEYFLCEVPKLPYHTGEKGVDAALIRDVERLCSGRRCDTVILVAGDGDYANLILAVQHDYAVKVEVAFFPEQTSKDLVSKASRFTDLSSNKDKITRQA